jgi:hypothetical protein
MTYARGEEDTEAGKNNAMSELEQRINATMAAAIVPLRDRVARVVASVSSRPPYLTVAKHFGTGSFAKIEDRFFLLSNAHVLGRKDLLKGIVLKNGAEMHTLNGAVAQSEDADLAITEIPDEEWSLGDRQAIEASLFDRPHDVPDGEICFFMGFPGVHSFTSVAERTVKTRAFPYAGQKIPNLTDR